MRRTEDHGVSVTVGSLSQEGCHRRGRGGREVEPFRAPGRDQIRQHCTAEQREFDHGPPRRAACGASDGFWRGWFGRHRQLLDLLDASSFGRTICPLNCRFVTKCYRAAQRWCGAASR
ncbi:hypothetical protein Y88_1052 [Novosphingobium nitrogenifigens DSM 19370]|uniref:Uncharacterized protein n=1 Tax=Novosphingobium nitrogenifigens DSM 19370 TaxID=983920 RepID=F1Z8N6_9SPHN|nr:hypothetical protein Y88_1052 [Novosphingobium nitrogenifigens DSM 19370]